MFLKELLLINLVLTLATVRNIIFVKFVLRKEVTNNARTAFVNFFLHTESIIFAEQLKGLYLCNIIRIYPWMF